MDSVKTEIIIMTTLAFLKFASIHMNITGSVTDGHIWYCHRMIVLTREGRIGNVETTGH